MSRKTDAWAKACTALGQAIAHAVPEVGVKLTFDIGNESEDVLLIPDIVLTRGNALAISGDAHFAYREAIGNAVKRGLATGHLESIDGFLRTRVPEGPRPTSAHERLALSENLDRLGLGAAQLFIDLDRARAVSGPA